MRIKRLVQARSDDLYTEKCEMMCWVCEVLVVL